MGYNVVLAKRIRYYLNNLNGLVIVERRMFGGLADHVQKLWSR